MFIFDKIAGSETSSCTKIERENGLSTISQKSLLIEHLDWLPLYLTSRERGTPTEQCSVKRIVNCNISILHLVQVCWKMNTSIFQLSLPIYWPAILYNTSHWLILEIKNAIKSDKSMWIKCCSKRPVELFNF